MVLMGGMIFFLKIFTRRIAFSEELMIQNDWRIMGVLRSPFAYYDMGGIGDIDHSFLPTPFLPRENKFLKKHCLRWNE